MRNRQWVLAAHARGEVGPDCWTLVDSDIPTPGEGQILLRTQWLSVDPFMRGRLNQGAGLALGDVMIGGGVGQVVESRHPGWKAGDLVESPEIGWQEFAVITPDLPGASRANRINPADDEPQAALSWLGMPGLTAYFATMEIARPQPGDTVVVSAAGGAVGQLAGQIAKLAGARVVGIAGSEEKLEWCRRLGFDATIDYKKSPDLAEDVARLCPEGVNAFLDGTGGPIQDAVIKNLAPGARVAVVGRVAVANDVLDADVGPRLSAALIRTRALVQGFVVYDWWHRRDEALRRMKAWRTAGRLEFREDVVQGFESVPTAFVRMMRGENRGKQLIAL
jgi:NADPH-dependent curcumin reductase CurA